MQQALICQSCGAEISSEARFCRKCGQPSAHFNAPSVTEGTTRLLDAPERPAPFDPNLHENRGGLAQATSPIHPQANPTNRSLEAPQSKPGNRVLLISLLVAAVLLGVAALLITLNKRSGESVTPPVVTVPGVPPALPPPPPPAPPAPPRGITQGGGIPQDMIYPGARTTMEVTSGDEGNVRQLQTSDSFEKVVSWYTERLKPTQVMREHNPDADEEDPKVILITEGMQVIINTERNRTNILIHQGGA